MIQYVRNGKGFPIGVLIAKLNAEGEIVLGHSKWCHSRDKYNKIEGLRIADSRADLDSRVPPALSILIPYQIFMARASAYFKAEFSRNTLQALQSAFRKFSGLKEQYAAEDAKYALEA